MFSLTASTGLVIQRPQPIQINQEEYPPKTSITSQLPTSTVMTSSRNPYDFPSANSPINQDLMTNMRWIKYLLNKKTLNKLYIKQLPISGLI